jgi:MoaA/NifB/PqqE/SkfB family radical SAM enzyme
MIKTTAIRPINNDGFGVIWDTGRRCNYDCTYCEATRHNNYSKFKSLEEYTTTFKFIDQWTKLYNSHKKKTASTNINFTGGEPTANPNFWELVDHIKKHDSAYHLSLTTNGAWGEQYRQKIIDNFGGVTISFHVEADSKQKDRVIENIIALSKTDIWLQVNIMLHIDYWDETVQLYERLKSLGINCKPRPIGDGNLIHKGWFIDSDGTNRRTSHEYTLEQQAWFFKESGIKKNPESVEEGNQIGRSCCGSRPLEGKIDNEWHPIKFIDTNFKNWYCMVNWFFLFIDQETNNVYHHQTCKATHDGAPGPIGTLNNTSAMFKDLEEYFKNPIPIICPNQRCGCGMCIPKAESLDEFNLLKSSKIIERVENV